MVFLSCSNFQIAILTSFFTAISAYMVGNDPYNRIETLDKSGKYQLEWLVDWNLKRVTFKVAAETTGYVGFGLSVNGKMSGADIVIGGVSSNGNPYFMVLNNYVFIIEQKYRTFGLLSNIKYIFFRRIIMLSHIKYPNGTLHKTGF